MIPGGREAGWWVKWALHNMSPESCVTKSYHLTSPGLHFPNYNKKKKTTGIRLNVP